MKLKTNLKAGEHCQDSLNNIINKLNEAATAVYSFSDCCRSDPNCLK